MKKLTIALVGYEDDLIKYEMALEELITRQCPTNPVKHDFELKDIEYTYAEIYVILYGEGQAQPMVNADLYRCLIRAKSFVEAGYGAKGVKIVLAECAFLDGEYDHFGDTKKVMVSSMEGL